MNLWLLLWQQASSMPSPHMLAFGLALLLAAVAWLIFAIVRRAFKDSREANSEQMDASPRVENSAAFMTASMQGVIRKLREQEKELERLHRIEKERAEHNERLSEEVTRNMPAGLLMVNSQGIVASANPAAEQVLGVRGLGYRRYSEVLGESSELTQLIGQCIAQGKIFRREQVDHKTPSGETRRLGATISPVRATDEKISGAICLLSDLTELAALQEQIELKKNLAALGELSAGIAHEFKNALATISGYAQMIRSESSDGEISDHAERILEQTRNITHVVTEFLKFARPLDISDEPVELQPLIGRAIDEISASAPGVSVRAEGDFGIVAGDEGLLRQVILNLARNGAEACEGKTAGRVSVRGEIVRGGDAPSQRITVQDNGSGISADAMPSLFHPFFTTKARGTGLGLAVVQKIILQHGGQIEARNHPSGGAVFIVTLPVRRAQAGEAVEWNKDVISR
ncbi:MAG TPA: ATP-binding protein [Candidatus Sulfotelmatobacter sp.]|nr:ATP-binding protein [Candidatus Sulfotelmatobacter sp.]